MMITATTFCPRITVTWDHKEGWKARITLDYEQGGSSGCTGFSKTSPDEAVLDGMKRLLEGANI